jgi:hypothetical protein
MIRADEDWPDVIYHDCTDFESVWRLHGEIQAAERRVRFWRLAFAVVLLAAAVGGVLLW